MTPHTLVDRPVGLLRAHADIFATATLIVVTLATRLKYLTRPLQGDEMISFSNMVLGRDFAGVLFGPFDSNSHLLNSLIMKIVYVVAGENPAFMRLASLVFGLLAVVLLYRFAAKELGRIAGFAAALLLALHPAMVLYSVSARGYAGMVVFAFASITLFLETMRSFSWPKVLLCAATGVLAAASHLFAVNVLIAQVVVVVLAVAWPSQRDNEPLRARACRFGPAILGPAIALVVLVGIYLPSLLHDTAAASDYLFQAAFPIAFVNFLAGFRYRTEPDVVSFLLLAPAAVGCVGVAKERTLGMTIGVLFLCPISLYVLSFFAPVFTLHPRFFVFLLPFFCFLIVAGLQHIARATGIRIRQDGRGATWVSAVACLSAVAVAGVFVERTHVPEGNRVLARAQAAVGEYVDHRPEVLFLTNDTGFVRVRLRQEGNMDRILPALGIIAIREQLELHPTGRVDYIYVPQKRYTDADLIHYQGKVPPEVKYQRDERLRNHLGSKATLELDLAPIVQIYSLRPEGDPGAP